MGAFLKDPYEYVYGIVHWELGEKGENIHDMVIAFRWRGGKI